jgi:hypothetical protein
MQHRRFVKRVTFDNLTELKRSLKQDNPTVKDAIEKALIGDVDAKSIISARALKVS